MEGAEATCSMSRGAMRCSAPFKPSTSSPYSTCPSSLTRPSLPCSSAATSAASHLFIACQHPTLGQDRTQNSGKREDRRGVCRPPRPSRWSQASSFLRLLVHSRPSVAAACRSPQMPSRSRGAGTSGPLTPPPTRSATCKRARTNTHFSTRSASLDTTPGRHTSPTPNARFDGTHPRMCQGVSLCVACGALPAALACVGSVLRTSNSSSRSSCPTSKSPSGAPRPHTPPTSPVPAPAPSTSARTHSPHTPSPHVSHQPTALSGIVLTTQRSAVASTRRGTHACATRACGDACARSLARSLSLIHI